MIGGEQGPPISGQGAPISGGDRQGPMPGPQGPSPATGAGHMSGLPPPASMGATAEAPTRFGDGDCCFFTSTGMMLGLLHLLGAPRLITGRKWSNM